MKITKLELRNFKRFDDLTIDMTALAGAPKLVLLIGTNGSGKSSVFDAFEVMNKVPKNDNGLDFHYYKKRPAEDFRVFAMTDKKTSTGEIVDAEVISEKTKRAFKVDSFYGRSSIRQVPQLTRKYIGDNPLAIENDADRPKIFIERDNRFENDVENVTLSILDDVFGDENPSTGAIRQRYINPINRSFENIFGGEENLTVRLISFKPPSQGKTAEILFEKGTSKIPYDYLSAGEKEIFNIMLNLLARGKYFTDTIYFLDEIDLHLNTFLQKNLLKEITENWIPDNCQLWTASHSLGFIEYANETQNAAIIDFDNLNFDIPQVIIPSPKNNFDVFEIAVSKDFLASVFEGKRIVFSENSDTPLYNNLNITNTIFFNGVNKGDVFHKAKNNPSYHGLIDRDYLTDEERVDLLMRYQSLYVLNYYSIENYLYHPDNLEEYYQLIGRDFDKDGYINNIKSVGKEIRLKVLMSLGIARESYPFYRENENNAILRSMRSDSAFEVFQQMFDSEDFEIFYKVFRAKIYGTQIKERQNLSRIDLAQTQWFKRKIEEVLTK